nr:helix-turn-helix domain-containing protein [Candidatus Njordarchaeota archaeon]
MRVEALSPREWAYLRGLYLADGTKRVTFCLGGNETELSLKLVELLRRAGLKPIVKSDRKEDMLLVSAWSLSLLEFLGRKSILMDDAELRRRFFEENRLMSVEFGVPFTAGLIDGDGFCQASVVDELGPFGKVNKWRWGFAQKKLPFLLDYFREFVESLAPGSVRLRERENGVVVAEVRQAGIEALLKAGIAFYSVKATQWLRRVEELVRTSRRRNYMTLSEVAEELRVGKPTVWRWLKTGRMQCVQWTARRLKNGEGTYPSHRYFHTDEVERVRVEIDDERERLRKVREDGGVKFNNVAKLLGVPRTTLRRWCRSGRVQATLVRGRNIDKGYWIPREEVERLKRELMKFDDR